MYIICIDIEDQHSHCCLNTVTVREGYQLEKFISKAVNTETSS